MEETTFEKELSFTKQDDRLRCLVIGVDEAGRGPLAGPVVAAAACYKAADFQIPEGLEKDFLLVRDSKTLSEKQREKVGALVEKYFYTGVGIVSAETIDRINILQAAFLAMKSAVASLARKLPRGEEAKFQLLVDGHFAIPNCAYSQEAIIGGDGSVKSIAAASIIAKVTRDKILKNFDNEYPRYNFAKHKGYGTKEHLAALRRFGPCPIHRMSFRPVLLSLPENVNKALAAALVKVKKR